MIHHTHTKKELCQIIEVFDLQEHFEDHWEMDKEEIVDKLETYLRDCKHIPRDDLYFVIEDVEQLKEYLQKPNQYRISVKEKDEMINIAKDIIFYCKQGFLLSMTDFYDIDDLVEKAQKISFYGNTPSIARAIRLLNKDPKIKTPIQIIQSGKVKLEQRRKKEKDLLKKGQYKATKGKYIVSFD